MPIAIFERSHLYRGFCMSVINSRTKRESTALMLLSRKLFRAVIRCLRSESYSIDNAGDFTF
jgi:hypothetical protein